MDQIYCVICREPIPKHKMLLKAVTCSKLHAKDLKNMRRRKRTRENCKYCHAPSTPEQRQLFLAWQKSQPGYQPPGRPKPKKPAEPDTNLGIADSDETVSNQPNKQIQA